MYTELRSICVCVYTEESQVIMGQHSLLLLLSLVAVQRLSHGVGDSCAQSRVAGCGQPAVEPITSRVVGGQEAPVGAWPWTVALTEVGVTNCAGAIISDRVILSAAHCFEHAESRDASRWTVQAGKHHLLKNERGQMKFSVEKIIMHDHYRNDTAENDIALLIVRGTIPFTTFIRPICIPDAVTSLSSGTACLVAGWGDTKNTAPTHVLTQVMVPVVSDETCGSPEWYYTAFIPQKTFCAGYEDGGKDSCSGDSGGPLITKSAAGRWYVNGIVSWGYICAEPRWPGVYTNVTYYLPWIHGHLLANGLPGLCPQSLIG